MAAKVHVAAYLEQATVDRIDGWSEKFGLSRSHMVAMLAEAGIENEGWMIDIVTSRYGIKVAKMLKAAGLLKEYEGQPVPPGAVKAT